MSIELKYESVVAPVLTTLDDSLARALAGAAKTQDVTGRAKPVEAAKGIIGRYTKFLADEKLIGEMDSTPFTPLAIQKTVPGTLSAMSKSVH